MEEVIYDLTGGDMTKADYYKYMKISEVQKILLIKAKNSFIEWLEIKKTGGEYA